MCVAKPWHTLAVTVSPGMGHVSLPVAQSQRLYEQSGSCANSPIDMERVRARSASRKGTGVSVVAPPGSVAALVNTRSRCVADTAAGSPARMRLFSQSWRCSSSTPTQRLRAVAYPSAHSGPVSARSAAGSRVGSGYT